MKKLSKITTILLVLFIAASCGGKKKYVRNPLDDIIRDHSADSNYAIILHDMDYNEDEKSYMHQYKVVVEKTNPDTVVSEVTDWKPVSDVMFDDHIDDMGMELVSKKNGNLKKTVAPPGYTNYVGNEKYGHWVQRDGNSFWEFYGKYAFMSSMFNMAMFPVRYSYWNNYYGNYMMGRPYYGPSMGGGYMYGTNSAYNTNRTSSRWNQRSSSFKSRVRSNVSKSSAKTRRSSSRYSKSSTKSRGGRSGK